MTSTPSPGAGAGLLPAWPEVGSRSQNQPDTSPTTVALSKHMVPNASLGLDWS